MHVGAIISRRFLLVYSFVQDMLRRRGGGIQKRRRKEKRKKEGERGKKEEEILVEHALSRFEYRSHQEPTVDEDREQGEFLENVHKIL